MFLAITLLLLFATVWTGLFLSRRFTEPLLAVAEATQRVAGGDDLAEVAIPATDEVAVLVDSFNAMVRRVRATEAEILASAKEMATLLATMPTGVLTVDVDGDLPAQSGGGTIIGHPGWAGRVARAPGRPGLERSTLSHRSSRVKRVRADSRQVGRSTTSRSR